MTPEVSKALDRLQTLDHAIVGTEEVDELAAAFGVSPDVVRLYPIDDDPPFAVLRNADGVRKFANAKERRRYADLATQLESNALADCALLLRSMNEKATHHKRKDGTKFRRIEFGEGILEQWAEATDSHRKRAASYREGVPYTTGTAGESVAIDLCRALGVDPGNYMGRGSQLRAAVAALRKHFEEVK